MFTFKFDMTLYKYCDIDMISYTSNYTVNTKYVLYMHIVIQSYKITHLL